MESDLLEDGLDIFRQTKRQIVREKILKNDKYCEPYLHFEKTKTS